MHSKTMTAVIFCNFLIALATGLTAPLIPLLIGTFTPSFTLLGVTTSFSALSSIFLMPVTSYLSDVKYSRKMTLVVLLVVYCFASSFLLFVGDVFSASIYFLLLGLANGYWTISKVLVIENTNTKETTIGIGTLLGLRNLARLSMGPFFASFLVISTFFAPFYVSVLFALAGLVVALMMIKEPKRTTRQNNNNPAKASTNIKTLFSDRLFLACSLIYVEMGIWHPYLMTYLVLYADEILHYSQSLICIIFSLGGLVVALSQILAGLVERLVSREKCLIACSFAASLIPVFFSFSFIPLMFAATLMCFNFLAALKDPSLVALAGSCSSSLRATVLSILSVVFFISSFLATIIEGIMLDLLGGAMLNLMVTILSLVTVIPSTLLILTKTK